MKPELVRLASGEVRHMGLHTRVRALQYDFEKRQGKLFMPECCCTDMGGCLAVFEAMDPGVCEIQVFEGERLDIIYLRGSAGWHALEGRARK